MKDRIDLEVDGLKLYVLKPTQKHTTDADFVYKTKYSEALRFGALTNSEAQRIINERSIWTEDDTTEVAKLLIKIAELGRDLERTTSLAKGIDILADMQECRTKVFAINAKRNSILDNTAESYADEKRLQHYIVMCTFDNATGKPYFKDMDDLIAKSDTRASALATRNVIYMLIGSGEDLRSSWPDWQWRKKHGLINENGEEMSELPDEFKKQLEVEMQPAVKAEPEVTKKSSKKKKE
jgi:hypothetical protein